MGLQKNGEKEGSLKGGRMEGADESKEGNQDGQGPVIKSKLWLSYM